MVGERTEEGLAGLTLESAAHGGIEATFVPEAGMIGCSLRHRGEELLGQRHGLRGYVESGSTMGIPFLHPWANRLGAPRIVTVLDNMATAYGEDRYRTSLLLRRKQASGRGF